MVTEVRQTRGIPLWLIREYLEEFGGVSDAHGLIAGPGWRIQLTQVEDFQLGSLRVGQVQVDIEVEEEVLPVLQAYLDLKLLRAGG